MTYDLLVIKNDDHTSMSGNIQLQTQMTSLLFQPESSSLLHADRVRDTYSISFSDPSDIRCANTAPMPYADASQY